MPTRIVETEQARAMALKFVETHALPFTMSVTAGKHRTTHQNRLQRLWCQEVAEQTGEYTAEEVRGYNKLRFGVPILRRDDDAFRAAYDANVRPLPYETKMALMMEPLSWPVTSLMTVKQKTEFLDTVHRHWTTERGVELTNPEDQGRAA